MLDPLGPVSDPAVENSPLNQPSTSTEFALTDTFTAWLENLKPALEPDKNIVPAVKDQPPVGELRFEGTLRVDCYVTGRLRSLTGTLFVSETGEIESEIFVATAIIDGVVHGDIYATERVELQSHAKVFGYIESPALAIQPGAVFEGQCDFLPSPCESAAALDREERQQHSHSDTSINAKQDLASGAGDEETEEEERFAAVAAAI
jgi:cytoskeletal protein CcmA (bactofilin family)